MIWHICFCKQCLEIELRKKNKYCPICKIEESEAYYLQPIVNQNKNIEYYVIDGKYDIIEKL